MLLQTPDKGAFVLIFWFQSQVSFLSAVVYTKASLIGREFASFFFSSPLSLSLSLCYVNCYCLLPQIAWEVCQMNGSTAAPFLADLYTTKHAGWPAIIQTNAPRPPARARLRLPAYKLDRCMLTVSAIVPSFFVRACLILSLPPSIFFIFTLFNKAEHLASGRHMDGQLCRWLRWKSTPGHVKEWDFQS